MPLGDARGQSHIAIGIEWHAVSGSAGVIHVNGFVRAMRSGESSLGLGPYRLAIGTACYAAEVAGAVLLLFGYIAGLYLAAVAMTILVAFMTSGAWLLIVGRSSRHFVVNETD